MAAWKRAGTCSLCLSRLSPLLPSSFVFLFPHYLMEKQIYIQVVLLFTCFGTVCIHRALFHYPSFCPVFPSCLFMLLLVLPDIFRDELQSTARGKKLEGEQFEQRASRFLPFHFHEDPFFPPTGPFLFHNIFLSVVVLLSFRSLSAHVILLEFPN